MPRTFIGVPVPIAFANPRHAEVFPTPPAACKITCPGRTSMFGMTKFGSSTSSNHAADVFCSSADFLYRYSPRAASQSLPLIRRPVAAANRAIRSSRTAGFRSASKIRPSSSWNSTEDISTRGDSFVTWTFASSG